MTLATVLMGKGFGVDPSALLDQILQGVGVVGAQGAMPRELFEALSNGDVRHTAKVANELIGRGSGLTPDGDDLLAAVAGTLVAVGRTCGYPTEVVDALRAALLPANRYELTTALGATLLGFGRGQHRRAGSRALRVRPHKRRLTRCGFAPLEHRALNWADVRHRHHRVGTRSRRARYKRRSFDLMPRGRAWPAHLAPGPRRPERR